MILHARREIDKSCRETPYAHYKIGIPFGMKLRVAQLVEVVNGDVQKHQPEFDRGTVEGVEYGESVFFGMPCACRERDVYGAEPHAI